MKKIILILMLFPLLLLQCTLSRAAEYPKYQVDATAVYDGDTFTIAAPVPVYKRHVRVKGVDTPEMGWRAKCAGERALAIKAKAFTKHAVDNADAVVIDYLSDDRNPGRVAARVLIDGTDLADLLIAAGLGHRFGSKDRKPRGKAPGWCQ